MPITLNKIANNTAQVTIPIGDESVTITYYPARVTEKVLARLQEIGNLNEDNVLAGFASFNETLASLIKSWDIYEDDAQTILLPADANHLADLPFSFRIQLVDAIIRDIRPEQLAP